MARNYDYEFEFMFDTPDEAFELASQFHEELRGMEDYIESNVILHFEGPRVSLAVFRDAGVYIKVDDAGNGPYLIVS